MNKNYLSKYSGVILFRGILAILFGLIALFWTGLTIKTIVVLFAIYASLSGIIMIIGSFSAKDHHEKWWIYLLNGILGIIIGVLIFVWPAITVLTLIYFVAIWAVIAGIMELIVGFSTKGEVIGKWLLSTVGAISLIVGITILFFPIISLEFIVWVIGVYALIFGISLTMFSFQIKK